MAVIQVISLCFKFNLTGLLFPSAGHCKCKRPTSQCILQVLCNGVVVGVEIEVGGQKLQCYMVDGDHLSLVLFWDAVKKNSKILDLILS